MIVDTSAVVAIVRQEPEHDALIQALARSTSARMSAATLVELSVVLWRRMGFTEPQLRALLDDLGIAVVPTTNDQGWTAARAYRKYGRGSGSGAGLNLGDCYSYALAREADEALLFVGDDFTATDLRRELP